MVVKWIVYCMSSSLLGLGYQPAGWLGNVSDMTYFVLNGGRKT